MKVCDTCGAKAFDDHSDFCTNCVDGVMVSDNETKFELSHDGDIYIDDGDNDDE